jgi:hypothetical protein
MLPVLLIVDLDRTHGTNRPNLQPSAGRYVPLRMTQGGELRAPLRLWRKEDEPCHAFNAEVQIQIRAAWYP